MTVAALPSTISYLEDGVSTVFPVPFRFKAASDLVVQRIAEGTAIALQLGTDYAVTGGGTDAGGTLTRTAATAGATLRIQRRTARAQPMIYTTEDRFPAKSHEEALDRSILIDQEQDAAIGDVTTRALAVPAGETGFVLPPIAARAGRLRLLASTSTGALAMVDGADFRGDPGGNVSDVGTFEAARMMDLTVVQPGTTTIRLSDRAKSTWQRQPAGLDLPGTHAAHENSFWFRDAGGAVWSLTGPLFSIEACGARQTSFENYGAIMGALAARDLFGGAVTIPVGDWRYNGRITNAGTIVGHGYGSRLRPQSNVGTIALVGDGAELCDFRMVWDNPGTRDESTIDTYGVWGFGAAQFLIRNVHIDSAAVGVLLNGCNNGVVTQCSVSNTLADGFHVSGLNPGAGVPSFAISFSDCRATNTGDDGFAVVSYRNQRAEAVYAPDGTTIVTPAREALCFDIQFTNCRSDRSAQRGMTVVGGSNVQWTNCRIRNAAKAGFLLDSESGFDTYATTAINVSNMQISSCGNEDYAALQIGARGGFDTSGVTLDNVRIQGSVRHAVALIGAVNMKPDTPGYNTQGYVRQADFSRLTIEDAGSAGIRADYVIDLSVNGWNLTRSGEGGAVLTHMSGRVSITDFVLEDVNLTGAATNDCINVSASTLDNGNLTIGNGKVRFNGPAQRYERILESYGAGEIVYNIVGPNGPASPAELYFNGGQGRQRITGAAVPDSDAAANDAGAAPTNAEFNALVAAHNALLDNYNALLATLRASGAIAA